MSVGRERDGAHKEWSGHAQSGHCQARPAFFISASMVVPSIEGEGATDTPADCRASILDLASPFPPMMMAPAWPILRPGGAVTPQMKPTIGFLADSPLLLIQSAASSSAPPPISPMKMMPSVSGSSWNFSKQSMNDVPLNGSPPMPTTVDWPSPTSVVWFTASYVSVPLRETTPILPTEWMWPGMMPILHSLGLMMPRQLGPMRRLLPPLCFI